MQKKASNRYELILHKEGTNNIFYMRSQNKVTTAQDIVKRYPESIEYVLKHGAPLEKAMVEVVLEAAGEVV